MGEYIDKIETMDTGGGCLVDFITLKDGRVVGINDECIVLYESMEHWERGGNTDSINLRYEL